MTLTFLAVHAHPDDEATSTGGLYRLLANEGERTVLVTCTNGEFGDAPGGIKPGEVGHDPDVVAEIRRGELDRSVEALGITRLVRLGYRDSGMMGWPQNNDPHAFWSTPVDEAAERLAVILREERPQVIVTYNEHGFYGHPDHIQAHRITMSALELIDYEPTLYFNAIPSSVMLIMRARWEEEGRLEREAELARGVVREPDPDPEEEFEMGTPDDEISATIDVTSVTDAKYDALAAHASQLDDSFWLKMGRDEFRRVMGTEWYWRVTNPEGLSGNVPDIFAGYR
ncbi:MAG TPA: PIG-L family deacetylase [Acidimicrobiales bacterium]|nr:PIG-L family deacetylase [Acidimicrobiales bacterium]